MTNEAAMVSVPDRVMPAVNLTVAMWRYLGEREAADLAYCARFGVAKAPEPVQVLAGVWGYTLPTDVPRR